MDDRCTHSQGISKAADKLLAGASVLSFSLDHWNDIWRGRHHILSRLARRNRVLHVTPPFYVRSMFGGLLSSTTIETGVVPITETLWTYNPPRWLPKIYRFPAIDRAITEMRHRQIRAAMERLGMRKPILYIWHPQMADAIGEFEECIVVYHCYDEYFSFYIDETVREAMRQQEQRVLRRADVVFAASEELVERRRKFNPNVRLIRNGVDYDLFVKAQDDATVVPDDLVQIRPPIIGCVATQMLMIDLPLILEIFSRRTDWSFVFIGIERVSDQVADEDLRAVQRLPNVHFIGPREISQIPRYLKGCQVCTIPWILNDISLVSSSPLKMYEYLAAGKPVVSKPLPLISHLTSVFRFARNADEWIDEIEAALSDNSSAHVQARQAVARENTWDQRVELISRTLVDYL